MGDSTLFHNNSNRSQGCIIIPSHDAVAVVEALTCLAAQALIPIHSRVKTTTMNSAAPAAQVQQHHNHNHKCSTNSGSKSTSGSTANFLLDCTAL
jgi:hypothetical protein